jgi:hypothetical protein
MLLIKYLKYVFKLLTLYYKKHKLQNKLFKTYSFDLFYQLQDIKREIRKIKKHD